MKDLIFICLKTSIIEMVYLVGIIVVAGLLLDIFERKGALYVQRAIGWKGVLATAWLGTPIHEIGHAIMCLIFLHRITEIRLFQPRGGDGVLGYVNHSYNKYSIYQRVGNFFIALGPMFSGMAVIAASMYLLLPDSFKQFEKYFLTTKNITEINLNFFTKPIISSFELIKSIFSLHNLQSITFWFFIFIVICVSSHIALSFADIKGALDGLVSMFFLVLFINLVAKYFNHNTISFFIRIAKYNSYIISVLVIALIFSLLTCVLNFILYVILSMVRKNRTDIFQ